MRYRLIIMILNMQFSGYRRRTRGVRLAGARKESTDSFLDTLFGCFYLAAAVAPLACRFRRRKIIPNASQKYLLLKQFLNAPDSMNARRSSFRAGRALAFA
ncbi:MAG: hypothetical protein K2W95_08785, partial [Candidatus Obscuribacterales bacterium]|nr:hypothetical protein [Candidatus Obscuribacterales bacterium]